MPRRPLSQSRRQREHFPSSLFSLGPQKVKWVRLPFLLSVGVLSSVLAFTSHSLADPTPLTPSAQPSEHPSDNPAGSSGSASHSPTPATSASAGHDSSPASSSGSHSDPLGDGWVKIHDVKIVELKAPLGGASPQARARNATKILERLSDEPEAGEVSAVADQDRFAIKVGQFTALELGPDDAAASSSLATLATGVATKIDSEIKAEQSRRSLSKRVVSFSMAVLLGLIAVLLVRKLGELLTRARAWLFAEGRHLPALQFQGIEVVSPAALRGTAGVALGAARFAGQFGIGYAWLLFALSLFDSTRDFSAKLTGFLVSPLSSLVSRIASTVPLLVVIGLAGVAIVLVIRFVGLFFDGVARGETSLEWLPPDLAPTTSLLIRAGIVLVSFVLGLPFVTGSSEGALSHAGMLALAAIALALTPLIASSAVGIALVFGRRLRTGDVVELGGRSGRIRALSLLDVRLEDDEGGDVRVPHLLSLFHPTRVLGRLAPAIVEVSTRGRARQAVVREALLSAARDIGASATVDLCGLDPDGARFRITVQSDNRSARSDLLLAVAETLEGMDVEIASAETSGPAFAPTVTPGPTYAGAPSIRGSNVPAWTGARVSSPSVVGPNTAASRATLTPPLPPIEARDATPPAGTIAPVSSKEGDS
ncbi:MAG: mechanosensitive ion channel [Polyangiaceae bacterium]